MTIADMLYNTDRDILFKIIAIYQLKSLCRLYFPQNLAGEEESGSKYSKLMLPNTYSGRVQRHNQALTQKHYLVIK